MRGRVPRYPDRLELLGDRADRETVAGGDQAGDHFNIVAQGKLAKALDRLFCIAFFFDDQLDFAAEDAAGLVDPVRPPLNGGERALTDACKHTRAGREHTYLHRPGLCE